MDRRLEEVRVRKQLKPPVGKDGPDSCGKLRTTFQDFPFTKHSKCSAIILSNIKHVTVKAKLKFVSPKKKCHKCFFPHIFKIYYKFTTRQNHTVKRYMFY